jgi:hypothetical protein
VNVLSFIRADVPKPDLAISSMSVATPLGVFELGVIGDFEGIMRMLEDASVLSNPTGTAE